MANPEVAGLSQIYRGGFHLRQAKGIRVANTWTMGFTFVASKRNLHKCVSLSIISYLRAKLGNLRSYRLGTTGEEDLDAKRHHLPGAAGLLEVQCQQDPAVAVMLEHGGERYSSGASSGQPQKTPLPLLRQVGGGAPASLSPHDLLKSYLPEEPRDGEPRPLPLPLDLEVTVRTLADSGYSNCSLSGTLLPGGANEVDLCLRGKGFRSDAH